MINNSVIFWIIVWSNVCCAASYSLEKYDSMVKHYDSVSEFDTLQIFFKEQDKSYVPAQRIVHSGRNTPLNMHNDSMLLNKPSLISRSSAFPRNEKGVFVLMGEGNPKMAYKFSCKSTEGTSKDFYIKYIHHTGVTEKLLDMPECSVELGSDNIQLNLPKLNEPSSGLDNHTIIDPAYVSKICKSIEEGKIFVINVESEIGKLKSYKVLRYKNNAFVHWKDWSPRRLFWKCIGKDLELGGFEDADKVQPEKEIEIDLWGQDGTRYYRNQRIAWFIKVLSIGSCSLAVCYLLLQDKIADILWK